MHETTHILIHRHAHTLTHRHTHTQRERERERERAREREREETFSVQSSSVFSAADKPWTGTCTYGFRV
jgi:hypothetical protein